MELGAVVGAGIALWIVLGLKNLGRINIVVMAALFGGYFRCPNVWMVLW